MDKFEQKEVKKIRPINNTWYDWLVNYIPEPIRKSAAGFKNKVTSLFKTNIPKQTVYGRGKKLSKPKAENKNRNLFILKRIKKEIKDRIIRNIWTYFETEEVKKEGKKFKKRN